MVSQISGICVSDAVFGYDHRAPVLKNVNAEFSAGDFVGVAGLNGSGKSTFLKSLAGLIPVLGGKITIDAKSLSHYAVRELSTVISIVLTEKVGGFNLTAFDFVAMGQMPYTNAFHRLRKGHLEAISIAMDRMGIKEFAEKELGALSDGMFQKTAIAKSLAQQTPVMLLDEPTAFLDYASKHQLFGLLKDVCANEGKCVLVSSHDLDLVLKYCSKVLLFSEGSCVLLGTEEALSTNAFRQLSGGFLG